MKVRAPAKARAPKAEPILKKTRQWKWNHAHMDARRAHAAVAAALRRGLIKRGVCEVCGSFRVDAHHDDYTKPLEVRFFCRRHHRQYHLAQRRQAA